MTAFSGLQSEIRGGQTLAGRYELVSLIGEGGMGRVYLARDLELDELVALKTLSRSVARVEGAMDRFRREVKLARRVTHRSVVRTFDIGEHEGLKFLTMEYIDGESLGAVIARGALSIKAAVAITREVGEALSVAHAAGVVHRDLKPDNVIMAKDGRVVVTDFGIARAFAGGASNLTNGQPTGTPTYMAPEQLEGREVDHRADIYALGELCYEMITGTEAWQGQSLLEVTTARLIREPPDPSEIARSTPRALAQAIVRAMARRPDDRFQDVSAFIEAITKIALPSEAGSHHPAVFSATQAAPPITEDRLIAFSVVDPAVARKKSVAVIPFQNMGTKEDEYLASGIGDAITDALSMDARLRVFSSGQVRAVYKQGDDPLVPSRALGVQVVVTGSIARVGDRLRIVARLIGVEDGVQLFAQKLEGAATDFFKLSDDTAEAVMRGLAFDRGTAASRDVPQDPVVLDLYLRAQHAIRIEEQDQAIVLLKEAMVRAPDEPSILATYALVQIWAYNFQVDAGLADEAALLAEDAAKRAVALASDAAILHLALGELALSYGHITDAVRELKEALRIDPRLAQAQCTLGYLFARTGQIELGQRLLRRAAALDPKMYVARDELTCLAELVGDTATVRDYFSREPPPDPDRWAYWLARARIRMWRDDVAGATADLALTKNGPLPPSTHMLNAVTTHTMTDEVSSLLTRLSRVGSRSVARTIYFSKVSAEIWTLAGNLDAAMHVLRQADAAGLYDVTWIDRCQALAPLRKRLEFQELRERVAVRAAVVRAALGEVSLP